MTLEGETRDESFESAQQICYVEEDVLDPPSMRYVHRRAAASRFRILRRYLRRGTVLEVGSGGGELVEITLNHGYKVVAIEHSALASDRLRDQFGIPVITGMLESATLDPNSYDAILNMHVIEHVPDPLLHLEAARRAVKPGGFMFLATPSLGSWSRRVSGLRWPGYSASHLCLFSADGLRRLLQKAGWNVIASYTNEHPIHWPWTLNYMRKKPNGVRPLVQAGGVTRKVPHSVTATVGRCLGVIAWPLFRLQSMLGGGYEIMVVAQAA